MPVPILHHLLMQYSRNRIRIRSDQIYAYWQWQGSRPSHRRISRARGTCRAPTAQSRLRMLPLSSASTARVLYPIVPTRHEVCSPSALAVDVDVAVDAAETQRQRGRRRPPLLIHCTYTVLYTVQYARIYCCAVRCEEAEAKQRVSGKLISARRWRALASARPIATVNCFGFRSRLRLRATTTTTTQQNGDALTLEPFDASGRPESSGWMRRGVMRRDQRTRERERERHEKNLEGNDDSSVETEASRAPRGVEREGKRREEKG